MILSINGTDVSHLVAGLKVGYETLVSEDSGRNAAGDTVLDIINRKIKLYVSFRPMFVNDMISLLGAMEPYVINVSFLDPKTNATKTIQVYHGTPEPEYYNVSMKLYKAFDLNFIEL
jgi:hypothetical protein